MLRPGRQQVVRVREQQRLPLVRNWMRRKC
jgi:hypothetical protein